MKINLNNIIIEYSKDLNYINDIINYIELNEKEILSFFRISKLSKKYTLKILNYDELKNILLINMEKLNHMLEVILIIKVIL